MMMMMMKYINCVKRYKLQTAKLTLQSHNYKFWWHVRYAKKCSLQSMVKKAD